MPVVLTSSASATGAGARWTDSIVTSSSQVPPHASWRGLFDYDDVDDDDDTEGDDYDDDDDDDDDGVR